jgi:hypothetical protein
MIELTAASAIRLDQCNTVVDAADIAIRNAKYNAECEADLIA